MANVNKQFKNIMVNKNYFIQIILWHYISIDTCNDIKMV